MALITGAASGLGESTTKLFCDHGAKVVMADIQDELGNSLSDSVGKSSTTYVHCDVTNEEHVKNAVNKAISTYGKLDIMFNNAGIVDDNKSRIVDNETADFERVMKINVTGVFLGMKHAARVMVPARSGCIISMASLASGIGGAASHAYCCSKHAVVGLTKNLAVELGQFGIRVNCISPFAAATPLSVRFVGLEGKDFEESMSSMAILKGPTLRAEDIAKTALYLASEDAQYVSGHNLFVDGGLSICNPVFGLFKYPCP